VQEQKVAIITGSTAGIGGEIATVLAKNDIRVVVTSRDQQRADNKIAEILAMGGEGIALSCSVESSSEFTALVEKTVNEYGRIDILINNAISHLTLPPLPIEDLTYEQITVGINTNLTNILALTSKAHMYLKASRGCVINIGSVVVNQHLLGVPLYSIVKGAMSQMTKVLAYEWAPDIRVNQINPGFIRTAAHKEIGVPDLEADAFLESFRQFHPLGRTGYPQDIASAVAYLISDQALWITGLEMNVDGGYSINGVSV